MPMCPYCNKYLPEYVSNDKYVEILLGEKSRLIGKLFTQHKKNEEIVEEKTNLEKACNDLKYQLATKEQELKDAYKKIDNLIKTNMNLINTNSEEKRKISEKLNKKIAEKENKINLLIKKNDSLEEHRWFLKRENSYIVAENEQLKILLRTPKRNSDEINKQMHRNDKILFNMHRTHLHICEEYLRNIMCSDTFFLFFDRTPQNIDGIFKYAPNFTVEDALTCIEKEINHIDQNNEKLKENKKKLKSAHFEKKSAQFEDDRCISGFEYEIIINNYRKELLNDFKVFFEYLQNQQIKKFSSNTFLRFMNLKYQDKKNILINPIANKKTKKMIEQQTKAHGGVVDNDTMNAITAFINHNKENFLKKEYIKHSDDYNYIELAKYKKKLDMYQKAATYKGDHRFISNISNDLEYIPRSNAYQKTAKQILNDYGKAYYLNHRADDALFNQI